MEKEAGGVLLFCPGLGLAGDAVGAAAARIAMGYVAKVTSSTGYRTSTNSTGDTTHNSIRYTRQSTRLSVTSEMPTSSLVRSWAPSGSTNVSMEEMIKPMRPGSVVVDIAIDQGGCFDVSANEFM